MKMAEWLRMMCNGSSPERQVDGRDRTSKDTARTPRVSLEKRRTDSQRGRKVPSARKNGLTRLESVGSQLGAGAGPVSASAGVSGKGAASVPVLQSGVSEGSVVRHTAESNWHTCLCPHCTAKRKTLGLEIGEIPTKRENKFRGKR